MSEANLSYEAKPSAINLPNLNINSYPKNMSPCNDFITYFFVDEMDIFTRLSRASIATYAIRLFTAWVINQSERGKSIKYSELPNKRDVALIRTAHIWSKDRAYWARFKPSLLLKSWYFGDISVNFGPILKI